MRLMADTRIISLCGYKRRRCRGRWVGVHSRVRLAGECDGFTGCEERNGYVPDRRDFMCIIELLWSVLLASFLAVAEVEMAWCR